METIEQFCERNGITHEEYYALKAKQSTMPPETYYEYPEHKNRKQRRKEQALSRRKA